MAEESIPQLWADQARYDLETARAMLESERYLYVLFCCQQAIEKMLKALIAQKTGEMPPRLHDLLSLSDRAGLEVDPDRLTLFQDLSRYYIQTRYPDEIAVLSRDLSRARARTVLEKTEAALQWLSSML